MAIKDHSIMVPGKNRGDVLMFTLSTCGWCMKTKQLLKDMGVEYKYIDVDLLDDEGLSDIDDMFGKWNPKRSFPTIVINNKKCIVGFQEEELRKLLK
ncbi:MAG: glutaredoxin family protein [Candidatus Bathyarchaeota archaeon]